MSWHGLWLVLPSGKRIAFLCWSLGSRYCIAVYNGLGINNVVANLKDCLIRVD